MSIAFVTLGMMVATVGRSIGLTESLLAQIGASLMLVFGVILLVPALNERFANLTTGLSSQADEQLNQITANENKSSLWGQFLGGILLGAVWSPCIGPTLGGAIALASQGENLLWAFAIMCSFALGVSAIIVGLGYGSQNLIRNNQHRLRWLAERAKPAMGIIFILVGLMILFKVHHFIEAWFIEVLPYWFQDLSVKF